MNTRKHFSLLLQAISVWVAFWLVGLPSYYQQYPLIGMAVASIILSVVISLAAIFVLLRGRAETRMSRAFWLSVYYTIPFMLLDSLYCGVYLGHGSGYLYTYWYLTVFYFTPWITFIPTAMLLKDADARSVGTASQAA